MTIKKILLFLTFLSFSLFLFAEEPVYKAGLPDVPGMMYRNPDGSAGGFVPEVTQALADKAGLQLEWVDGSWTELYSKVLSGEIDMLPGTMITLERKKDLDFLEGGGLYLQWGELFIHPDDEYSDLYDLEHKVIALVENDNNGLGFVRYTSNFEVPTSQSFYSDFNHAFEAVMNGEAYGVAAPSGGISQSLKHGLKPTGLIFNPTTVSISFTQGKNPELQRRLSEELDSQKLYRESSYYALVEQFRVGEHESEAISYIPLWILWVLLIALLLSGIVITFLYLLDKQVKEKSRDLQDHKNRLNQAMLTARMGYWEIDSETERIHLSSELFTILGLTQVKEHLTLNDLDHLLIPESAEILRQGFRKWGRLNESFDEILSVTTLDQSVFWLEIIGNRKENSVNPNDRSLGSMRGICVDKTEQVLKEQDLTEKEDMLRQTQKMKFIGQLAGGIAHDFNNMLAGIIGYAEILNNELEGEQKTYTDNIIEISDRATELTAQLLSYAQKERVVTNKLDTHKCIESVYNFLSRTLKSPIQLTLELDALHSVVNGDFSKIENSLINIAMNSRDAMPKGGWLSFRTVNETLSIKDCSAFPFKIDPGEYVKIEIEDTGFGIDPRYLDRVFDPFFTTKEQGKATGLGLSSSYGTVIQHQGAMKVQSDLNKGTIVTIFLPVAS